MTPVILALMASCGFAEEWVPQDMQIKETVLHFSGEHEFSMPATLTPLSQIVISDDTDINGSKTIVADTMEHDGEWNIILQTEPGLFEPNGRYFMTLRYHILDRGTEANDSFYYFFESKKEQERYPWAWHSFIGFREQPDGSMMRQRKTSLGPYDDYVFMIGIRNKGKIVIEELRIDKVNTWTREGLAETEVIVTDDVPYEPYGVCANIGLPWLYQEDEEIRRAVRLSAEAGIQWIRFVVGWSFLEPDQGDIREEYLRRFDVAMDEADKLGVKYYLSLLGLPKWASPYPDHESAWAFAPTNMDDWREHVRMVTAYFKDRVDIWEVWNEQDWIFWLSPLEDFVPLLRATTETIKSVDPDAQILIGGLATDGVQGWDNPDADTNALQRLYDAGAKEWFDILAIHTYSPNGIDLIDRVNTAWSVMEKNGDGDKRIWINEVGLATINKRTEEDQAAYLEEILDVGLRHPMVDRIFWYNLWCVGDDPEYNEHNFGILNHDWSPRLAYERLKAMPKRQQRVVNPELWERNPSPVNVTRTDTVKP